MFNLCGALSCRLKTPEAVAGCDIDRLTEILVAGKLIIFIHRHTHTHIHTQTQTQTHTHTYTHTNTHTHLLCSIDNSSNEKDHLHIWCYPFPVCLSRPLISCTCCVAGSAGPKKLSEQQQHNNERRAARMIHQVSTYDSLCKHRVWSMAAAFMLCTGRLIISVSTSCHI